MIKYLFVLICLVISFEACATQFCCPYRRYYDTMRDDTFFYGYDVYAAPYGDPLPVNRYFVRPPCFYGYGINYCYMHKQYYECAYPNGTRVFGYSRY